MVDGYHSYSLAKSLVYNDRDFNSLARYENSAMGMIYNVKVNGRIWIKVK